LTIAEALRKLPSLDLQTTPTDPVVVVLATTASTFIFDRPAGGTIHLTVSLVTLFA
jgi:hypothetical protein